MKVQRGKKPKYLIRAEIGLLNDHIWQQTLHNYPTSLVCLIRQKLLKEVPGMTESFNTKSRYFGYWTGNDKDRLYIYVQKNNLRIDLCINREYEKNIKKNSFGVIFVNNFQSQNNWITGWRVPHNTENKEAIMKWLLKAFDRN